MYQLYIVHHLLGNTCFGQYQIRAHQHKDEDILLLKYFRNKEFRKIKLQKIFVLKLINLPLKQMKYLLHSKGCGCRVTSSFNGQI